MRAIRQRRISAHDYTLDLVPTSPLCIAWVLVNPANILSDLGLDGLEKEWIDGIESIREDELGPSKDPQLVAERIEIIETTIRRCIGRLVAPASPNTKLWLST